MADNIEPIILEDETPAIAETFIDALTEERDNLRAELAAAKRATENITSNRDAIKLQLTNAAKGILSIIDEDLDRRVSEMVEEHLENINWDNHADDIKNALPDWDIGEYTDNINDACKDNLRDILREATVSIEL
tara:strand:- start:218 stop:619 length:402 start_codon:yes stop_codon:yes gene_type:complete